MVISVKSGFLKAIFLCILALAAGRVEARVDDGTHIDANLVRNLMSWVESRTGTTVPVLPRVIASRSEFKKILVAMGRSFAGRPQSLYIPGTVYMNNLWWDAEDPVQLSLLVHELVHHAQLFMTETKWPCPDAREVMAYQLQNQWLEENGHSPFVRAAWIERVSACPGESNSLQLAQTPSE